MTLVRGDLHTTVPPGRPGTLSKTFGPGCRCWTYRRRQGPLEGGTVEPSPSRGLTGTGSDTGMRHRTVSPSSVPRPPCHWDRLRWVYLGYEGPEQDTQVRRGNRSTNIRGSCTVSRSSFDVTSETRTLVQDGLVHSYAHRVSRRNPCTPCPLCDGGDDGDFDEDDGTDCETSDPGPRAGNGPRPLPYCKRSRGRRGQESPLVPEGEGIEYWYGIHTEVLT